VCGRRDYCSFTVHELIVECLHEEIVHMLEAMIENAHTRVLVFTKAALSIEVIGRCAVAVECKVTRKNLFVLGVVDVPGQSALGMEMPSGAIRCRLP
jgi:hypothetical protein